MSRRQILAEVLHRVLVRSRRRCCICYGLNRDTAIKAGQVAHIDRDSSNSDEDNLVYLCIPCHDKYDSKSRQSKNFTALEILHFRKELDNALESAFAGEVRFGEAQARRARRVSFR